jgi:arylsulfatase A-like enzyme
MPSLFLSRAQGAAWEGNVDRTLHAANSAADLRRFGTTWATIAGALPFVLAAWGYELAMLSFGQFGGWRTWGLFAVLALATTMAAWVMAALALRFGLARASSRFLRCVRGAFCLTAAVNLVVVGAAIFHSTAEPALFYGVTTLPVLITAVAYWRHTEAARWLVAQTLCRLGLVALVAPWLAAPGVAWAYSEHRAQGGLSPQIPKDTLVMPDAPKRIIMITFDALRYRSTSFATPDRQPTPGLRALGAEGTWYANCHAAGDRTLLSMPTILTGVRPHTFYDAVDNRGGYLREGLLTGLGGLLAPAGYRAHRSTMLVSPLHFGLSSEFSKGGVLNPVFEPLHFTNQGFIPLHLVAEYAMVGLQETVPEAPVHPVLATRATFDRALELLRGESGRTYLWVHVGAPHAPYYDVPAEDLGGELHPERYAMVDDAQVRDADAPTLARQERVYEAYVRFADAELARFVRRLKAEGLWEESLVVVTADHGESFLPASRQHGNERLNEDITHVPLVIRAPGQRGDRRVDRPVAHEDIVPTILARVYGRSPTGLVGHDLFGAPAAAERVTYTWSAFYHRVELGQRARGSLAAYQGRTKFVASRLSGEALYDLAADPHEQHDLSRIRPKTLAALKARARRDFGR